MAFTKRHLKNTVFQADLGPCPGSEIRGEDIEFGRRLLKGGSRLWYEPSAIVHHAVADNRLQKEYFLRFLYDNGRALIRGKDPAPPVWFIPRLYFAIPKIIVGIAPGENSQLALFNRSAAQISTQMHGLDRNRSDCRNPSYHFAGKNDGQWPGSPSHHRHRRT